ncbi:hypothetical protein TNCV_3653281 [Trichonephila clavipes]|nr:hypothetical protein TNCV_3653281 [Trichonephila clavipes]
MYSAFAACEYSKQPSSRASCLVMLVAGGGRPLTLPQGVLPQNWSGTELNRTVTCIVLRPTTGVPLPRWISWASMSDRCHEAQQQSHRN